MSRICEVTLNTIDCEALPDSGDGIRTTCFACGGPACKGCSALVTYCGRRCRVCADCLEDRRDELDVPEAVRRRLGLTEPRIFGSSRANNGQTIRTRK